MKTRKPGILNEETKTDPLFFNKQGGEHSFFTGPGTTQPNVTVQKKCDDCEEEEQVQKKQSVQLKEEGAADAVPPPVDNATKTGTGGTGMAMPAAPAAMYVVEDVVVPEAGQMRKTDFLNRLKSEVCATVTDALAGTLYTSDNCPYIRSSFDRHQNSSAAQVQALIIRYAPAAAKATSAEGMILAMKVKAYTVAFQLALTGGDLSGAAMLFGDAPGGIGSGISSITSGLGLFFKANAGGPKTAQSPQNIMQSLGKGSPIEGGTRSKMENAFGTSFSGVEVHTDHNAAQLSEGMNARAFTVGNHIAFAAGEHQPDNITGQALMAHELAHTIQQRDGGMSAEQREADGEREADSAAVQAVKSISGKDDGKKVNLKRKGLSVQRCKNKKEEPDKDDGGVPEDKKPEEPPPPFYSMVTKGGPDYTAVDGDSWNKIAKNTYGSEHYGEFVKNNNTVLLTHKKTGKPRGLRAGDTVKVPAMTLPAEVLDAEHMAKPSDSFKKDDPLSVPVGQITFDAEGSNDSKSKYYSRKPSVPDDNSGVTLGRGFDMKGRDGDRIVRELKAAGLSDTDAEKFRGASGKKGATARKFITDNTLTDFEITEEQQNKLFQTEYLVKFNDTFARIFAKETLGKQQDEQGNPISAGIDPNTMDPKIIEILVDLDYRGDLDSGWSKVRDSVIANDLTAFTAVMCDEAKWPNVVKNAKDRFKRRCDYLTPPAPEPVKPDGGAQKELDDKKNK